MAIAPSDWKAVEPASFRLDGRLAVITGSSDGLGGKVAYGSAKAATLRVTAGLSTEWAPHGVRVDALAPTATLSDFTRGTMAANPERAQRLVAHIKLGRFAEMSDHVGPAIFFASPASDFVTGHTLLSDGGWLGASF